MVGMLWATELGFDFRLGHWSALAVYCIPLVWFIFRRLARRDSGQEFSAHRVPSVNPGGVAASGTPPPGHRSGSGGTVPPSPSRCRREKGTVTSSLARKETIWEKTHWIAEVVPHFWTRG